MINTGENNKVISLKYLIVADRLAAWVLLIVAVVYGITGYGMTKGLIPADIARALHLSWLGAIGLVAFIIHTSWAVHLALKRHSLWNSFSKVFLVAFYIILIIFFGWVHFFYESNLNSASHPEESTARVSAATSTVVLNTVFTAENLKIYNGLNGQPSYIAVKGIVYDVSDLFRNGEHYGCRAGQDLTQKFYEEHSDNFLRGYDIVGTYLVK